MTKVVDVTFDTETLLIFFLCEEGSDVVEKYLRNVESESIHGFINAVNLSEFYYILYRRDTEAAEEYFQGILNSKLKFVGVDKNLTRLAGIIKGKYAISLGDAFCIATAFSKKTAVLAGSDPELNQVKDVEIIRVR